MTAGRRELRIKLTVTGDEHPGLHQVLLDIAEPRRRTRRLKDLAATGLLVERSGGMVMSMPTTRAAPAMEVADMPADAVSLAQWDEKAD